MTMSNSNWWANKLGNQNPRQPGVQSSPTPQVPYTPPAQQPNVQVNYDPDNDQLVTRAQSAKKSDHCPECNSGNYFAPTGTQRMRCYDCGYPVVQQGSGLSSSGTGNGPTQKAKQVGQSGGFNPNVIVDRIG
jgi:ribosomal protein S27AE